MRFVLVLRLTQEKSDFHARARPQFDGCLQGGAWIESSSHSSGHRLFALQRCRPFERAIAAKKFRTVAGERAWLPAHVGKADAPPELPAPHASRKDGSRVRIGLRDDVGSRRRTGAAEEPFDVCGDRYASPR